MTEPTHRQHLILQGLQSGQISKYKKDSDDDMEDIWELVRAGYLKNFVLLGGSADWNFNLTQKAIEYLNTFGETNKKCKNCECKNAPNFTYCYECGSYL